MEEYHYDNYKFILNIFIHIVNQNKRYIEFINTI